MTCIRCFLDTNLYVHFQPFQQVDWRKEINHEKVVIVVPPIVIRELNKIKDSPDRPKRIRKRAGATLIEFERLEEIGLSAPLREGVKIQFLQKDPVLDFAEKGLSRDLSDDWFIASVLEFVGENQDEEVALVTNDMGVRLKARRFGIETRKPSDKLLLPQESDPEQVEIQKLRKALAKLENAIPKLTLCFEEESQHRKFRLDAPLESSEEEIASTLEQIRKKYPATPILSSEESDKVDAPAKPVEQMLTQFRVLMESRIDMNKITENEIRRYNNGLEVFYRECEQYLVALNNHKNLERRTIRLDIVLLNSGSSPAEDVDIWLHFPDGFDLLDERSLPRPPSEPHPPSPPMSMAERLSNIDFSPNIPNLDALYNRNIADEIMRPVSRPRISRTDSYTVELNAPKLKHKHVLDLDPLFVVFPSFEQAGSFTIEYQILAGNMPEEENGKLHVIIEK